MIWFSQKDKRSSADVAWSALAQVQAEQILRLERQNDSLHTRLETMQTHYANLVERMTAPQLVATKVVLPSSPEGQAMVGTKSQYVERMIEDFVQHAGMDPKMAREEAERLARAAEDRMY